MSIFKLSPYPASGNDDLKNRRPTITTKHAFVTNPNDGTDASCRNGRNAYVTDDTTFVANTRFTTVSNRSAVLRRQSLVRNSYSWWTIFTGSLARCFIEFVCSVRRNIIQLMYFRRHFPILVLYIYRVSLNSAGFSVHIPHYRTVRTNVLSKFSSSFSAQHLYNITQPLYSNNSPPTQKYLIITDSQFPLYSTPF